MRTKTHTLFGLLVMMAACIPALTGCSHEDSTVTPDNAVKLNALVRTSDESTVYWQTSDQVGISTEKGNTGIFTYIAAAGQWQVAPGSAPLLASFPATFTGYYPATTPGTSITAFTLPNVSNAEADQKDEAKLRAADWMTAPAVRVENNSQPLDLTFEHRLSRIVIQISEYGNELIDQQDGSVEDITEFATYSYGNNFTLDVNGIVSTTGDKIVVRPFVSEDTSNKKLHSYTAIVAPHNYQNELITSVQIGGSNLDVKHTGEILSGHTYRFQLKVGKYKLELKQVTDLPGWDDETDL